MYIATMGVRGFYFPLIKKDDYTIIVHFYKDSQDLLRLSMA